MAPSGVEESRRRLVAAAVRVLAARGLARLTLEAVAAEAGLSKGGLLHHFPTKEALIEGVLRQFFDDFAAEVERALEPGPPRPGRWLRAYVRATFADAALPLEIGPLLWGAIGEHPRLRALVQADFARWEARLLDDGVPAARARVVRQAADAWWGERLIGMAPDDPATRADLVAELVRLTERER